MSNININEYLNIELSNILSNEIEKYIGNCIDTGNLEYTGKIDIEDEDADEVIDELTYKMFNDFDNGFSFAELADVSGFLGNRTITLIQLIQYCNNFYEENYGKEALIDWKDFDNCDKIINHAGYVFVNDNQEWFVETWNNLNNSTGEYKCLK